MRYISRQEKQGTWMASFDLLICNRYPVLSGRIDWNTANHYYHSGVTPSEGAEKYLLNPDNLPENAVRIIAKG